MDRDSVMDFRKKSFRPKLSSFSVALTVSDLFGLSSYHLSSRVRCASLRSLAYAVHLCLVFALLATGHFLLMDTYRANSAVQSSFFGFRLWLRFVSAVTVLGVQALSRDRVLACHEACGERVSAIRTVLLHFLIYLTHFLVLHFNYRLSLFPNLYHGSLILFFAQIPAIQFEYLMASVGKRVDELNGELGRFEKAARDRGAAAFVVRPRRAGGQQKAFADAEIGKGEILKIRAKYLAITELTSLITSTYSYQVLIVIAGYFIEIFIIIQTFFFDFIKKSNFNTFRDFAYKAYFAVTFFFKVATLARAGENYLRQCKRTDLVLCRITNASMGRHTETRRFMLLKILKPATVTMSGLFQLNYRFLYAIGCSCINSGLLIAMFYVDYLTKDEGETFE